MSDTTRTETPSIADKISIQTQKLVEEFAAPFGNSATIKLERSESLSFGSFKLYSTTLNVGTEESPDPLFLLIYKPFLEPSNITRTSSEELTTPAVRAQLEVLNENKFPKSRKIVLIDLRAIPVSLSPISPENVILFNRLNEVVFCEYIIVVENTFKGDLFGSLLETRLESLNSLEQNNVFVKTFNDAAKAGKDLQRSLKQ